MVDKIIASGFRKNFLEQFHKNLFPILQEYESERKNRLCLGVFFLGLGIIGSVAIAPFTLTAGDADVAVLTVAPTVVGLMVWDYIKKSFENKIKERIMPTVCSCFGELRWEYGYPKHVNENDFSRSLLIPAFTTCSFDDIFYGVYNDTPYAIVEGDYTFKAGKHSHQVFDGIILRIKVSKKFFSHTVIRPDALFKIIDFGRLERTEFEDVVFEKKFDVYTDDPVEARYLITPAFMQRLNTIKVAFNADKISCAFYQGELLIALATRKDLFNIGSLICPMDDVRPYYQMFEEIDSIVNLIDYLKLDKNPHKKL